MLRLDHTLLFVYLLTWMRLCRKHICLSLSISLPDLTSLFKKTGNQKLNVYQLSLLVTDNVLQVKNCKVVYTEIRTLGHFRNPRHACPSVAKVFRLRPLYWRESTNSFASVQQPHEPVKDADFDCNQWKLWDVAYGFRNGGIWHHLKHLCGVLV